MTKTIFDRQAGHVIWCPGCNEYHVLSSSWTFNGDLANPTFSPSLLVRWLQGEDKVSVVCHSFIRDGNIQFLDDCTHKLAGQTIELEECDWRE